MRKQKIYLETTLFNYYFDTDRDAHADTVKLFKEIAAGKYEAFTSQYVVDELKKASDPKRSKMLSLIPEYGIIVLETSDVASWLADIYIAEGIIPQTHRDDGLHIAIATVNKLDVIFSLNFKHIVKGRTIVDTRRINFSHGFQAIELNSPMGVDDNENA
jgi:predicted nucleic acid-binding protein